LSIRKEILASFGTGAPVGTGDSAKVTQSGGSTWARWRVNSINQKGTIDQKANKALSGGCGTTTERQGRSLPTRVYGKTILSDGQRGRESAGGPKSKRGKALSQTQGALSWVGASCN